MISMPVFLFGKIMAFVVRYPYLLLIAAIAVAVCDGESKLPSDRKELMRRYRQLVEEKRVAFTTFHQSMDYEEFVEGII